MLATTIHKSNTTPHHQVERKQTPLPQEKCHHLRFPKNIRGEEMEGLLPQSPIVCLAAGSDEPKSVCCAPEPETHYRPGPSNESSRSPNPHHLWAGLDLVVLLRKEVIQPHLPVRLPCYDFVPIADPTFDGSLPEGLGHRLRVLPTFMT